MIFSYSRVQEYLRCRHAFALAYIKNIDSRKRTAPLLLGSAVHKYLDMWVQKAPPKMCEKAYSDVFDKYFDENRLLLKEDMVDLLVEKARGEAMCAAYVEKNKADIKRFKLVIPEKEITITLPNGRKFLSYTDRLVQEHDGSWSILETKTVSSQVLNPDYFMKIRKDNQVLAYARAAKESTGVLPEKVYWDMLIKTQHRQTKKESPSMFVRRLEGLYRENPDLIKREEFLISPKAVESWEAQMCILTDEISAYLARKGDKGVWCKNTSQCSTVLGACKFLNICASGKIDPAMYKKKESDR